MILNFGKYGCNIFNAQKTLDNFYSHQHSDGVDEKGDPIIRFSGGGTTQLLVRFNGREYSYRV